VRVANEIAAIHAQQTHPAAQVGGFRRTTVLVPLDSEGGLCSEKLGGVQWLYAFTNETSLVRFARTMNNFGGEYTTVEGSRLLDVAMPAVDGPAGVALDAGGPQPMFFLGRAPQ